MKKGKNSYKFNSGARKRKKEKRKSNKSRNLSDKRDDCGGF